MKILYSPHFARSYRKAPDAIRQAFDKQSLLLLQNLRHPSLHAKEYDESADLWQARVTGSWRSTSRSRAIPTGWERSKPTLKREPWTRTARHFASSAKGLRPPPAPRTTRPTMAAAAALSRTRRNKPTRSEVSSERDPIEIGR